ncbi:MAG: class I SAM-dependent methyltransferase [Ignavibacteria bacterium]|jgi:SAM-dependent methyltransferase|nr:class I SAM-dependent methyltransferase [Ignavibacteria bacterium]MCU7501720.1 class I SAM-dependent methyltransferase [Ignavibacteria bacterium]MCU7516873.1 class I SAM-dependent methyltransferase [Ignavibacteria bacterium]
MAEWFKDWFDSSEYLEVYKHRNDEDARRLFKLILGNVSIRPGGSVLDIACGAGRHSVLFSSAGYKVTAFDLSRNLLQVAKRKSRELQLDIDFFNADVRHPALKKQFDLIINLFTSFGYFESDEENFALFNDANELLCEKGFFVFDYFNIFFLKKNLVAETTDSANGRTVIQKRAIIKNRVVKEIRLINSSGEKTYTESVCLYAEDEIVCALENAGLKAVKTFGDYAGGAFSKEKSQRLIIIAGK